jgi:glutathione S-transferase
VLRTRRLAGTGTTPVLLIDDRVIGDSTEIVAELEQRWPGPPLYPRVDRDRKRALALEEHFDTELGPYIRGALFTAILPHRHTVLQATVQGLGRGTRATYRATYPLIRRVLDRALVQKPGGGEHCRQKTLEQLAYLEGELGDREYLVGDAFSVADLTAAALFSPLVAPPEFSYWMPETWPPEWEEMRRSLADRPGFLWVAETFRRHRGTSAEVN